MNSEHAPKLVRDRIPEIVTAQGATFRLAQVPPDAWFAALCNKLHEEVEELADAPLDNRLDELADVFEVLVEAAKASGFDLDTVRSAADDKRSTRGGFTKRILMYDYRATPA